MENNNKVVKPVKDSETKQTGKSYTVKSFGNNIKNLIETKLVNEEDGKKLKEIHEKVVKQFLGFNLFE